MVFTRDLFGVLEKYHCQAMITQLYKSAENHSIVYFKKTNFAVYKLGLNKAGCFFFFFLSGICLLKCGGEIILLAFL